MRATIWLVICLAAIHADRAAAQPADPAADASVAESRRDPPGEEEREELLAPKLLASDERVLVHFVPASRPDGILWNWNPYGDLLVTSIADGTMRRVMTAGVEGVPTRRAKYVETIIDAVGLDGDRLYVVASTTISWDRPPDYRTTPPAARNASGGDAPRLRAIAVFDSSSGKRLRSWNPTEEDDLTVLGLPATRASSVPLALDAERVVTLKKLIAEPSRSR